MALDRIPGDANLYIGGLFSLRRAQALKAANVTHVVSALRRPLDEGLFAAYKHLLVELDDVADEDILQHFAASNAFIQDGLDGGGGVLVHCAMGKSRSTTLIMAYLLHRSSSLTPQAALTMVRVCRPMAEPNSGFMEQLRLYHRMGCPSDVSTHPVYQRWLYQREVEMSVACGQAPDKIRFGDEVEGEPKTQDEMNYRCRKCRRSLATSTYLIPHVPKHSGADPDTATNPISSINDVTAQSKLRCSHLFVDPLSWMRLELGQGKLEGRLECPNPKCRTNVGKYAWQGMKCSCGEWVLPAISLARGRVDEMQSKTRGLIGGPGGKI